MAKDMQFKGKRERGMCKTCKKVVCVNRDGTLAGHYPPSITRRKADGSKNQWCYGSAEKGWKVDDAGKPIPRVRVSELSAPRGSHRDSESNGSSVSGVRDEDEAAPVSFPRTGTAPTSATDVLAILAKELTEPGNLHCLGCGVENPVARRFFQLIRSARYGRELAVRERTNSQK